MKTKKAMFTSKSDNYKTPEVIYDYYMDLGYMDPCPYNLNWTIDGLKLKWTDKVFVNPPYSDIKSWVDKAIVHHTLTDAEIIFLIPARTDTIYFHKLLDYGIDLQLIKGRLRFSDLGPAPFPSVFIRLTGKTSKLEVIYKF